MSVEVGGIVDGRYVVERELRRTATRATYFVRHLHVDKSLEMDALLERTDEAVQRFQAEARLLSKFRVRDVEDFGRMPSGQLYLVCKYEPGMLLSQQLPLTPPRTAAVVRALATHLAGAHAMGVVVRVLRRDTILVCNDGTARVVDFSHAEESADPSVDLHALAVLLVELTGSAKGLADALAPVPDVKPPERNPFDF